MKNSLPQKGVQSPMGAVSFLDQKFSIIEIDGEPFTPVRPIVDGMGLDWATQFRKLTSNRKRWCVVKMTTLFKSGNQEMVCMPVRKLPAFFATISPNKCNPEIRETVERYLEECDDVLWRYWSGKTVQSRENQVQEGTKPAGVVSFGGFGHLIYAVNGEPYILLGKLVKHMGLVWEHEIVNINPHIKDWGIITIHCTGKPLCKTGYKDWLAIPLRNAPVYLNTLNWHAGLKVRRYRQGFVNKLWKEWSSFIETPINPRPLPPSVLPAGYVYQKKLPYLPSAPRPLPTRKARVAASPERQVFEEMHRLLSESINDARGIPSDETWLEKIIRLLKEAWERSTTEERQELERDLTWISIRPQREAV
ncbi:phage antirepressor N-terminal domain-containing protein [Magnetococcales bacterium HHB-1]